MSNIPLGGRGALRRDTEQGSEFADRQRAGAHFRSHPCQCGVPGSPHSTLGGRAPVFPSDCVVGPDGRLWITDPTGRDLDHRATPGNVWALDLATHSLEPMVDGVLFPNGIEFSTDARSLFVAESATGRVLRFSLGADGTWERDPWRVPRLDGVPDCLVVDADDHVWVACSFSRTVVRLSPDGDIRARLDFGTHATPTALCFAGSDL